MGCIFKTALEKVNHFLIVLGHIRLVRLVVVHRIGRAALSTAIVAVALHGAGEWKARSGIKARIVLLFFSFWAPSRLVRWN